MTKSNLPAVFWTKNIKSLNKGTRVYPKSIFNTFPIKLSTNPDTLITNLPTVL